MKGSSNCTKEATVSSRENAPHSQMKYIVTKDEYIPLLTPPASLVGVRVLSQFLLVLGRERIWVWAIHL